MDATRYRRVKSAIHQQWYARWRLLRFASHLGFLEPEKEPEGVAACVPIAAPALANQVRCWRDRTTMDALN